MVLLVLMCMHGTYKSPFLMQYNLDLKCTKLALLFSEFVAVL